MAKKQDPIEIHQVELEFDSSSTSLESEGPEYFAYEIEGNVNCLSGDAFEKKTLMGKFRVFYMDADAAMNAEDSIFDIFDARSATAEYWKPFFGGKNGWPTEDLIEALGEQPGQANVLILDRLELLPEFRGRGWGLLVLRRLIERFSGGIGCVAMKPFPLQFEHTYREGERTEWTEQLRLADFPTNEEKATARLYKHYAKLGFKRLPNTSFMVLGADLPLVKVSKLPRPR